MTTDELKALLAKATRGPWKWRLKDGPEWFLSPGILKVEGGMTDGTPMGDMTDRANARLIAMAPDLAAEVIALREQKARLVDALKPFAAIPDPTNPGAWLPDHPVWGRNGVVITVGDFAEARAILAEIEKEAGE